MKKLYPLLFVSVFAFNANAQDVLPKLSPVTKTYLLELKNNKGQQNLLPGYIYKKRADGKVCVSAIIKIESSAASKVQDQLSKLNVSVGTKAGPVWTVQVPLENVSVFINCKGINYIQLDEPVMPELDVARTTTRVDSVHGGYNLPMGYNGKNVLVGIIDFGFDYNHPSMYDTSGNKYRIIKAWEMNGTGTPPAGFSYGNEIADTLGLKARGTDNEVQTHGTGVAGLAAGSGFGSPTAGKFKGVAYESEMVLVGVRRDSIGKQWLTGGFSDFIDGVNYLTQYAKSVGKPIVINISWGSHSGPHDGSSLVNQAFDTLSGKGKIIVMSAGNEGRNNLHLGKTFTGSDTTVSTFLDFTTKTYKRTWVDIWGDTAKTFCVKTSLYSKGIAGATTGRICIDNSTKLDTLISANGLDTCYVQTITSAAEYNMKPRVTINIFNKATDSVGITVTGNSGKINLWDEYYYYGYPYRYQSSFTSLSFPWATSGNTATTVSDMGAGKSTLLIGAYNSKLYYVDINTNPHLLSPGTVGYISYFSSKGPMIDGRIKPDICAPGLTIATSVNSYDTSYTETGDQSGGVVSKFFDPKTGRNYYYGEFSGTSASAPMASGIVALLLQIDPSLTPERVKEILFSTAIVDAGTGIIPATGTNLWGHGKINAYGAARKLVKELSISSFSGSKKLDCVLFPNPNKGEFTLDFMSNQSDNVSVSVLDISGKILQSQNWKVSGGQNNLSLNLSTFSKGIYFVQVQSNEGSISIKTLIQ